MLVRKLSKALASIRRIPRNRQIRHHSNQTTCFPSRTLVELRHRGLVELEGEDTFKLLQGLTTNDIDELSPDKPVQYSMLLNLKGRVLYDLLIYRHKELGCMLECDSESTSGVIKHLRKYMLRSKVTAKDVSNEYSVIEL